MNGLDSPIEALTFIPVNLGTVISALLANNLWALLAVITATVSLWRFRNTTTKTTPSIVSPPLPPPPPPPTTTTTNSVISMSFKCMGIDESPQKQEQEQEAVLTRGNSKKFFTVYLEAREDDDDDHVDDYGDGDDDMEGGDESEENASRVVMRKRWGSLNESTVEMRGDFGWYSYQNRKVIDGSVVRLWGERESVCCVSPRSCRTKRTDALVLA